MLSFVFSLQSYLYHTFNGVSICLISRVALPRVARRVISGSCHSRTRGNCMIILQSDRHIFFPSVALRDTDTVKVAKVV